MDMKSKKKIICPIVYLFSFLIPVIIAFLAFFNIQIYPGGSNTLLIYDMKNELFPTYAYLSDPGPGFDSLFHTMSGALGSNFLARIAHDCSFFDLVYKFVPVNYLPEAIYFVTLFKIGLCGLCMSIFLYSKHRNDTGNVCIVLLSSCYALMSYIFIFALWPLWMDLVMLFPLLALSVERIIAGKKSPQFILLLSLGMISDYHITYMAIIALTLYFFFRLAENGTGFAECRKTTIAYMIHGIISAGLSSFILFPIVRDLIAGKLSSSAETEEITLIKNNLFDILKSFLPGNYSTLLNNASPNIFCGLIVLLLALIWFAFGKNELRGRIFGAVVLIIYFASFIFGPLDSIWHGFREPVGFSVRYSFTFVFFMICFAVRGAAVLRKRTIKISAVMQRILSVMIILFTAVELFVNGSYILARLSVDYTYTNKNEYIRTGNFMTGLIGMADLDSAGEYYRMYKDFCYTLYDGALFGYDGLLVLDSNLNPEFVSFMNEIGIAASPQRINEFGITPPTASLFDFRYFLSNSAESDLYERIGEFNHHYLYRNEYALPLIFGTSVDPDDDLKEFTDDPYENINMIYSDFLGDRVDIFVEQDCTLSYPEPDMYQTEYTAGAADYYFTPDKEGIFWLYSAFKITNNTLLSAINEYGSFAAPVYADVRLNDEIVGSFRDSNYSYCNEIGTLRSSEEVKVSLETSYSELGNTYIYRYDEEVLGEASESLNDKGFNITYIGDKGIIAEGDMNKNGYVFISLPYNPGYIVYVDGQKTDYTSYRDMFMLVGMSEGHHEIRIRFIPDGLCSGMIVSVIFLVIMIIYLRFNGKTKILEKKSVKHP